MWHRKEEGMRGGAPRAVGAEARSRLAEARRQLANAQVAGIDPISALQGVQAADQLADQAMALAQQDEARFQDSQRQQTGGMGMGGLGPVILGGILIDAMSRGGGFGGGFGGSSGGSRSGGSGMRLPGPGSFGGSATRGRRGGGGRF